MIPRRRHMREKSIIKYPEKSLKYSLPQTLAQKINDKWHREKKNKQEKKTMSLCKYDSISTEFMTVSVI